ncbi:hypothetical protein BC830DRAFT_832632 [Chytriomyces sp. MP71]|nr:hypothetical protein BC830DRAFT_832632 [Chytriomyces sp. MP71]
MPSGWPFCAVCATVCGFSLPSSFTVFDALRNETAILTMMDITTYGFGFMLNFGDLNRSRSPSHTLQLRYLSTNSMHLHLFAVTLLIRKRNDMGWRFFESGWMKVRVELEVVTSMTSGIGILETLAIPRGKARLGGMQFLSGICERYVRI